MQVKTQEYTWQTNKIYLHDSCLIYGLLLAQKRRVGVPEMLSFCHHNLNGVKQVGKTC